MTQYDSLLLLYNRVRRSSPDDDDDILHGGLLFQRRRETPRTSLSGSTCSLTWTLSLIPTCWENRENMNFTTHRISAPTRPGYGGALQTGTRGLLLKRNPQKTSAIQACLLQYLFCSQSCCRKLNKPAPHFSAIEKCCI